MGLEVPRRASIAGFGKLESAFSTWDIFYQHHDNKDKSNIFKTSGIRACFGFVFGSEIGIMFGGSGASLWALHGKGKNCLTILHLGLGSYAGPQVFDKAAILHFASSNKMMLAANSANQGDNKVARRRAQYLIKLGFQNQDPKTGSFAVTHGRTLRV